MENNKLQANITQHDECVCECNSIFFVPCYVVARIKNPLINQPPIVVSPQHPSGYLCAQCGKHFDPVNTKTRREIEEAKPKITLV
jgi:hypothetical protein